MILYDRKKPDLGVLHAELLAVVPHDGLHLLEVRARHAREQVVLDLVVQAAHHEVDGRAALDVPRREHLATQEVDLHAGRDDRHALVVRRERAAEHDAEQRHLHADERERPCWAGGGRRARRRTGPAG